MPIPSGTFLMGSERHYPEESPAHEVGVGLEVSAIGLNCMGMRHAYGAPKPKHEMIVLLRAAVARGATCF